MFNKQYLQDDSNNYSFLRVLLTYMGILLGYIVLVWSIVFLKEAFDGNENGYAGLPEILAAVFGTGILGIAGKVLQKREEIKAIIGGNPIKPNIPEQPDSSNEEQPEEIEHEPEMLIRRVFSNHIKTLGLGLLVKGSKELLSFKTIELPWTSNVPMISCIPEGVYKAVATTRASNPTKYAIHIDPVPGRSEIMIHTANFVRQLEGCIAPGRKFMDLDKDGIIDVAISQEVMDELQNYLPINTRFKITIVDEWRHVGNVPIEELLKS